MELPHHGLSVIGAALFIAGEMAGSGVLALSRAVVDCGKNFSLTDQCRKKTNNSKYPSRIISPTMRRIRDNPELRNSIFKFESKVKIEFSRGSSRLTIDKNTIF